ncbi:MAG TPA: 2-oxoglutarate dehydrogenase complex dihydrolipoyllysine-residue succinyltransferase [Vicinamibacterales bacterium]|nr:2-oxoglutarate dehydrogenase complex dihydrolipoyllysine-residue succinyltransferase [Vicinamibacterales bacterium]
MSINVVVPELGESVVEARVARWLKNEGDYVAAGEPLVELETEKTDLEVSAPRAGLLQRIERPDGADVKIGERLATIDESAAGAPAAVTAPAAPAAAPEPAPAPPAAPAPTREADRLRATPVAQRVARERAVDLAAVRGTGDRGRVMRQDVESHPGAPPSAEAAPAPAPLPVQPRAATGDRLDERVRMSKRRLTIARRLVEAQHTAAMLTTFNEIDMTAVMDLRQRRRDEFKARHGIGLGIASFFVKASIAALREFPRLNAEIQGEEMVLKHYYDIGMAVGAAEGLVVPVIRDADRLSFAEVEQAIKLYSQKAAARTLSLDDLRGGTFTITNGGVFGSLLSTPILNPPQVGILGLHKIQDRVVPLKGQIVVRPMMYVALSYDHRIVDGREAVQFLVRLKDFVEDPGTLLLEV